MALKANQAIRWIQRIGILMLGLTANNVMVYWWDFTVYPSLIANYGLVRGWLYAAGGSTLLCLATLWFYNLTKQDWLLIETLKNVRDDQPITDRPTDRFRMFFWKFRRFFWNLANRGDALTFLFLSVWKDSFITAVYMRKGVENYAMTARDWKIFWASALISEVWWGLAVFGVMEIFKRWLTPLIPSTILNWLYFLIEIVEAFNRLLASFIPPFILNWLGF